MFKLLADETNGVAIKYIREEETDHFPLTIGEEGGEEIYQINEDGKIAITYVGEFANEMFSIKNSTEDLFTVNSDGWCYSEGVVVKHSPFFPDYVFELEYEPMSL